MKLFGQIIGALVETAKLPVKVAIDVVQIPKDLVYDDPIGHRTKEQLEEIKEAAKEE